MVLEPAFLDLSYLGHPGLGRTALFVENNSTFNAGIDATEINVSGIITANNFILNNFSDILLMWYRLGTLVVEA